MPKKESALSRVVKKVTGRKKVARRVTPDRDEPRDRKPSPSAMDRLSGRDLARYKRRRGLK